MHGECKGEGHTLWIRGEDKPHPCGREEKALSALERDQVKEIRVGCRQGGCGACRVRVVSGDYETGKMSRDHVSEEEEKEGYALSCRLFPKSDLVLEPAFRRRPRKQDTPE
jgi:CDP-4-dehydro-6-deoxyglucose reductase